jgi:hypothetical protein
LLIHIRGGVLYNQKWNPAQDYLVFDHSYFLSGVNQILLYTADKRIISERLLFSYSENETARTNFSTDKANYAAKQRIISTVKITDINATPLSGNTTQPQHRAASSPRPTSKKRTSRT